MKKNVLIMNRDLQLPCDSIMIFMTSGLIILLPFLQHRVEVEDVHVQLEYEYNMNFPRHIIIFLIKNNSLQLFVTDPVSDKL